MHADAYAWVARCVYELGDELAGAHVVDLGGAHRNPGAPHARDLFPWARLYLIVDADNAPGVELVADVTEPLPWNGPTLELGFYDVVICTELLEHVARWRVVLDNAAALLRNGGTLIATCAGPGRPPHSMRADTDDAELGEHYAGVSRAEVHDALVSAGVWGGWSEPLVTGDLNDTYVVARRSNRVPLLGDAPPA